MNSATRKPVRPLLYLLGWFVRLRWVAGAAVVAGAAIEWRLLGWFENPGAMAAVGGVILLYNSALWLMMRGDFSGKKSLPQNVDGKMGRSEGGMQSPAISPSTSSISLPSHSPSAPSSRHRLMVNAWAQLLLDMASLTLLVILTGGAGSPLLGFFVFHMVFATLLLPRTMAYAGAVLTMLMLAVGLALAGLWPATRRDDVVLLGWAVTVLMTVWLANGITRSLRRQRRRLVRQNRRIRAMSGKLKSQQQGMIQQEKMAASGRMAAGVAHEIANPLASMDGLLQLMERRPEKVRPEAVATLREQVARISQIVRRMTEFAHPGDGQWQDVSLNELLDKTIEMMRFDPRLKRVEIERQYSTDLPPVRVLVDSVQQIIVNLVINALDAMEKVAQPKLVLRTQHATGWCAVEIRDNGHGMEPQQLKRVFEPFFTTKPVGKGTGLGLSISYSLVRKLGGSIQVESRAGQGARFEVKLPASEGEVLPESGSASRQRCNS